MQIQVLQSKKQRLLSKKEKLKEAILQEKSAKLADINWNKTGKNFLNIRIKY